MKSITSLFGLIQTEDIESNGAKDFMNGIYRGIANVDNMEQLHNIINK